MCLLTVGKRTQCNSLCMMCDCNTMKVCCNLEAMPQPDLLNWLDAGTWQGSWSSWTEQPGQHLLHELQYPEPGAHCAPYAQVLEEEV